ncbi:hypothetical protein NFI96_023018 [Prochilodus magdalenae]|nr:hypothetical protein NFI96_023018 [Prochilodus magdalenae]
MPDPVEPFPRRSPQSQFNSGRLREQIPLGSSGRHYQRPVTPLGPSEAPCRAVEVGEGCSRVLFSRVLPEAGSELLLLLSGNTLEELLRSPELHLFLCSPVGTCHTTADASRAREHAGLPFKYRAEFLDSSTFTLPFPLRTEESVIIHTDEHTVTRYSGVLTLRYEFLYKHCSAAPILTRVGVSTVPDTVSVVPDGVSVEPDTVTVEPDTVSVEPDTVTVEPDTVTVEPDTVTVEPDTVTVVPDSLSKEVFPGLKMTSPPPRPVPVERRMSTVGSRSNPDKFLGQDYHQLHRDFCEHRARFLDSTFLPDRNAIGPGLLTDEQMDKVEWIRPTKLVRDPHLVVDGESRFDFAQGELGNCWFLSAIGAITFQGDILDQIIPAGQSFKKDYAGIFHFRASTPVPHSWPLYQKPLIFWRFGRWIDVVIDDKLPMIDGQLIFVHCKTSNEFWPALLEKAYAKVCGSYADMNGGFVSEALTDFTGGVHMTLRPREGHPELWGLMYRATGYKSIMGCGTPQGATPENTELPNGIVEGHAYTITSVTKVRTQNGQSVKLLRLLNPWGHREWRGDWSDNSPLWRTVSTEERTRWLDNKNDGEFWMSMEDFCRSFMNVDVCCSTPAFLDGSSPSTWTTVQYEGCWDERTAGGSMDHKQSFWTNPQYRVKIPAIQPEGEEPQGPNLLVSLMQKPDNKHRRLVQHLHIGFSVFAVSIPPEFEGILGTHTLATFLHAFLLQMKDHTVFPASFFTANALVAQSRGGSTTREVMEFFRMKPGRYLIVPFTYKPDDTTSFLLTVHSKRE